ncbi:helix-turn-helix domain-containing protein [Flagellimonas sp.]|uniref:helix-turn-helix domain-containing protein n=1 Tax=Flagellimonas sp. TaxID=2058762 RepID=UPI003B502B94
MNEAIIERIRTVINHYGLTVSTFADKIGVQRSSISHLLNGRNRPSLDFVLKVVQTYPEVNLYWLLNGKGEFPPKENLEHSSPILDSDVFNTEERTIKSSTTEKNQKEPVKIVIFYADGSFESFNAKN